MNSDVIAKESFATDELMKNGAHYITLESDEISYSNNTGKFVMFYATPNMPAKPFDKEHPKKSTRNVINDDELGVKKITTSNYIEVTVPKHFFYVTEVIIHPNTYGCGKGGLGGCGPTAEVMRKTYKKGQKFVVINAGGDVDRPCVVGVVV